MTLACGGHQTETLRQYVPFAGRVQCTIPTGFKQHSVKIFWTRGHFSHLSLVKVALSTIKQLQQALCNYSWELELTAEIKELKHVPSLVKSFAKCGKWLSEDLDEL